VDNDIIIPAFVILCDCNTDIAHWLFGHSAYITLDKGSLLSSTFRQRIDYGENMEGMKAKG